MTYHIFVDDDDDLDEEAIPGFTHPGMPATPRSPVPDKGKSRATDQLATPSGGSQFPRTPLSGNIGSAPVGTPHSARRMVGGVQVETRCASVPLISGLSGTHCDCAGVPG